MKKYKVIYSSMFYDDLTEIVLHIFEISQSKAIATRFYTNAIKAIEKRSNTADCFEKFVPYEGAPDYYRIYFNKYIVFYTLETEYMNVRRMLWCGSDIPGRIQ